MRCAIVDVDGTLLSKPGSEARLIAHLLRRGYLGPRQAAAALWFLARYLPRYGIHIAKVNKAYLAGISREQVNDVAERFVHEHLVTRLRKPLVERIAEHRRRGEPVALLTGSLDVIARPLAAHLQVNDWRATQCTIAGDRYTAKPPRSHPFSASKLELARELCHALGSSLAEAVAYGDSSHDLPLLYAVGHAVCVAPDRCLRRHAQWNDWEIVGG